MAKSRSDAESEPSWVWHSSVESVRENRVSVLALIETIAAMIAYSVIALRYGTTHLVIAACVAPLLLLRTDRSTQLALRWARSVVARGTALATVAWRKDMRVLPLFGFWKTAMLCAAGSAIGASLSHFSVDVQLSDFLWASLAVLLLPFIAVPAGIRVFATVVSSAQNPLTTVAEIPQNWWRIVVATDSCFPPEVVPGATSTRGHRDGPLDPDCTLDPLSSLLSGFYNSWKARRSWLQGVLLLLGNGLITIALTVPAWLYRWSIKGTALIYLPLIYIVRSSQRESTEEHLEDVRDRATFKLARAVGVLSIVVFAVRLMAALSWNELVGWWEQLPRAIQRGADAYLNLNRVSIPIWMWASLANALLVWGLWIFADNMLTKHARSGEPIPDSVQTTLRSSLLARGALSIYTISCLLYTTAALVPTLDWPPLGSRLFPWQ